MLCVSLEFEIINECGILRKQNRGSLLKAASDCLTHERKLGLDKELQKHVL